MDGMNCEVERMAEEPASRVADRCARRLGLSVDVRGKPDT